MKKWVEKLGKQFIAIILVLAMCLQTGVAATCGGEKTVVKHVLGEDGHYYSLEFSKTSEEILTLKVLDETTHDMFTAKYNKGCVYATKQVYCGKDFLGKDKYNMTYREKYDFSGIIKGQVKEVSAAGYGSKVVMALPYKSNGTYYDFYYRIGTSAPDKGYAEIGCVRKYRVEITGPFVQDYIEKVDECNMYYRASGVTAGGVAILAVAAVIVLLTGPALAAVVTAALGSGVDAAGITCIINCYMAYKAADRFFDLAKEHGERIY